MNLLLIFLVLFLLLGGGFGSYHVYNTRDPFLGSSLGVIVVVVVVVLLLRGRL